MKKLLLVIAALFVYANTQAQEEDSTATDTHMSKAKAFYCTTYKARNSGSFSKNTMLLSLSYGFPNTLYSGDYIGYSYYGVNGLGLGPIMLRYEFAVHDEVGIAIFGQVATKSWTNYNYNENATGVGGGVLGMYHLNKWIPVSKLDVYIGVGVDIHHDDINYAAYNNYHFNTPGVIVNPAGVVGARYYFSKPFGVFAELGDTGFSYANVGFTWRITAKGMHHTRKGSEPHRGGPGE